MVSHKVPNASSIRKIECDSSIQTYATDKKHHGPCTCEIVYHHSNSKIESGQNISYETLMAHLRFLEHLSGQIMLRREKCISL